MPARATLSPVKQAILEIRSLRERLAEYEQRAHEPIAIVGIGCRFPGQVADPESFWALLRDGRDAVSEIPRARWNVDALYDPDPDAPGTMSTRWGGFLDDVDCFDPDFFGVSERETSSLDPQQRLLLEVAWEALENGGIAPQSLFKSPTGVFVGIGSFDYAQLQLQRNNRAEIDAYLATGNSHSVAAGRLSYVLGLQGPSLAIDTACSSSLVAVHLACQSLRARECTRALAGGVNVILAPELLINFSKAHMMAADGRCKVFDAAADGFVRAEGCGIVVLQRLSDALARGARVLALIRGSAVNQDGRSSGLTAPNGLSQQAVLRAALKNAGLSPADVDYVEAHGTGTSLGDPIEMQALGAVYGEGRSTDTPLRVGSVKTNLGHAEAAAGVAGLIKSVLAIQHGFVPPHLHLTRRNPHIDWAAYPVTVPTAGEAWPSPGRPRRAGVSSFGFSGTNAHILLEEAPRRPPEASAVGERPAHVITVSARTDAGLCTAARRLADHLKAHPGLALGDVAFTTNVGRKHHPVRCAVIAESAAGAREALLAAADGTAAPHCFTGRADGGQPGSVFLFTDPAPGRTFGRALYRSQPVFRTTMARCDELLRPHIGCSIIGLLHASDQRPAGHERFIHPILFTLQYSLAELWRSWGVQPAASVGVGIGEQVMSCVAGSLDLEAALRHSVEAGRGAPAEPGSTAADVVSNDTARFIEAVRALYARGHRVFFDMGGNPALTDSARHGLANPDVLWVSSPEEGAEWAQLLAATAQLHVRGVGIDWEAFDRGYTRQRVTLPTQVFARRRCWFDGSPPPPAGTPLFAAVEPRVREQAAQAPLDLHVDSYPAKWAVLGRLALAHMLITFQQAGAWRPGQRSQTDADAAALCTTVPSRTRLVSRCIDRLREAGLLHACEGGYVASVDGREMLRAARSEAASVLMDAPFLLEYVERCGAALPGVITGRVNPVETLFGGDAGQLAEQIYSHLSMSRYFNAVMRAAVDAALSAGSADHHLRVLEIGGGTGGTTAAVAPGLPAARTSYVFTDLSPHFVARAAGRFKGLDHLTCRTLDIEQDPRSQGLQPRSFDIVLASNVLHATRHLDEAVAHVQSLIAPGGLLVAYEITTPLVWLDITFGLLDGWHRFDDRIRGETPILTCASWLSLLRDQGFEQVAAFPEPGSPADALGAHVLIAQAPGSHRPHVTAVEEPRRGRAASAPAMDTSVAGLLQEMAAPGADRRNLLVEFVRRHVATVLSSSQPELIDRRARLLDLGLDSLMAVELRDRLGDGLPLTRRLPATLVFDYPSVEAIAGLLDGALPGTSAAHDEALDLATVTGESAREAEILAMSDAEVEAVLMKKLEGWT